MRLLAQPVALAFAASCLVSLLQPIAAHSWLECTDYRIDPSSDDAKTWSPDKCLGRARCTGPRPSSASQFGDDKGFDHHASSCQCARGTDGNETLVAQYTPGQRVCLAYPSKNHVAAPCTNAFIPDAGVRITRTKVNPASDDDEPAAPKADYTQGNGNHVSGSIDYKGFQHCPNFCDNMDRSLCTMCFDLESDLAPGSYTFKWIWDFHGGDDIYTSCWEATVGNGQQPQAPVATVATVNSLIYAAAPPSNPEATQASMPTATSPSSTPMATGLSPSPTPTVYAAVAADADEDCEDELDVAGGDEDADCEDELDMAAGNGDEVDCEEELDMAAGMGEIGADADHGYGQEADHAHPGTPAKSEYGGGHDTAQKPATGDHETPQSPGTGGNYGGGHDGGQNPAPGGTTGGEYGHEATQIPPTTGGGHGNAPSPATGGAQVPSTGNNPPASTGNNNNNQGSTQHGQEYGHSHGGHYPHSHGTTHSGHDNVKHDEGQPSATSTGGNTQSVLKAEVDSGCEQGLTLAKDKPTENSGGATNNNGKAVDTPVAYPANPQGLEATAAPPAYTPETGTEAQNPEATPPASTPETGADADHGPGQGYGHQSPSQPASGDATVTTPEPDCDETLPVAEPAANPAASVSSETTEDPDCDEKLPYAYGNPTPEVQGEADKTEIPEVQGEADDDCDKGIPIASEAPGKGGQAGVHHGPHHRNQYQQQGASYSFKSEQKFLESDPQNPNANAAGVVVPYPSE